MVLSAKDGRMYTKSKQTFFIVMDYVNKHAEYINFRKIFKIPDVLRASPFKSPNLSKPTISYKYPGTIRSRVLNYKEAYDDKDCDISKMTCDCSNNQFLDKHHKHVITGDLAFIQNNKLRTLLSKGLNYRDQAPPSTDKAYKAAKKAVNQYCKDMSERYKKSKEEFAEWKTLILEQVQKQLQNCSFYPHNVTLSDDMVKNELKLLHDKFVLIPTDKAANNITIVCKKYYISSIQKEIEPVKLSLLRSWPYVY